MNRPKRILLCPLNWGLGHATRCIPIIKELRKQNAKVFLASDGRAYDLLQKEFADLAIFPLPSYAIHYGSRHMILSMLAQAPKILRAIQLEKKAIDRLVQKLKIDIIISDNRYGCLHQESYNILLTHQINIKAPYKWIEKGLQPINHHFIKQFHECWIPDIATMANLSGSLSHNHSFLPLKYIGPLSRLVALDLPIKYDIIAILSGPEPQRSLLEHRLIEQAKKLDYRFLIVAGQSEKAYSNEKLSDNISFIPFLSSMALNEAINSSKLIVSRSGYSTIMDLAKLGKQALLVPTPGQTEQEYLALRMKNKQAFHIQTQDALNLAEGIPEAFKYPGLNPSDYTNELLPNMIRDLIQS